MNNNLDQLIPTKILACLNSNHIEFRLVLQGYASQGRWPCVKISIDHCVVFQGAVENLSDQTFVLTAESNQTQCVLEIEYINKTEQDTVVDDQGNILENQHIVIKHLFANNVDIVNNQLIHQGFGQYSMKLSQEKIDYFLKNGYSIKDSTTLEMFENGTWTLIFGLPILNFLTLKQQVYTNQWEQVDIYSLLQELHQRMLICEQLEKISSKQNQNTSEQQRSAWYMNKT
jgi:hypothetical protein